MSDAAFAQDAMRGYVDSRPGTNLKQKLGSAAASLKWSYSRAKAVLYGEARRIDATEMEELCRAAKVDRYVRKVADEHQELTARLARMEGMLAALMAGLDRTPIDPSQPPARRSGDAVGAGAPAGNA